MNIQDKLISRLQGNGQEETLNSVISKANGSYDRQTELLIQRLELGKLSLAELLVLRPELFDEHPPNANVRFI